MAAKAATAEKVEFLYEGTNRGGSKVKGEIFALSDTLAKNELRKQGINPLKVKKKPKPLFGGAAKIVPADIAIFARQMATMMQAGVPLVQSFEIIGQGSDKQSLQKMILGIKSEVEGGVSLAEALSKQPLYFDPLFVNLVNAGEQSGALETMLDKLATYKEKVEALKAKVKKALFYPIAVLIVAFIVTVILLVFVVPQFEELFTSFGADLPALTKMVINLSQFMQSWWWAIAGGIAGAVMLLLRIKKTSPRMQEAFDRAALKAPVVGEIATKSAIARYARTLETMSAAGVPLVEAMDSVAGACGNIIYYKASLKIKDEVSQGTQLQTAMRNTGLFPNMAIQMVSIGEEAGSLDAMLARVADFYETEVDNAVDALTSLLEPIIMAVLGVLVGGLIVAMYLPIFKLGSVV
ncbi:MAG: type II secretion system F family protein [Gammaproteobacteria bacterium]|nr:type II secretion system F family protein [Gammaproteobacteria bacterium]MDH3450192.1 type II secretion system F family protein [Gammaproteobacteria bacterium]